MSFLLLLFLPGCCLRLRWGAHVGRFYQHALFLVVCWQVCRSFQGFLAGRIKRRSRTDTLISSPFFMCAFCAGAACDYLSALGMDRVHDFEHEIGTYLYERLSKVQGVTIYGPSPKQAGARGRASLAAFNVEVSWPLLSHISPSFQAVCFLQTLQLHTVTHHSFRPFPLLQAHAL